MFVADSPLLLTGNVLTVAEVLQLYRWGLYSKLKSQIIENLCLRKKKGGTVSNA